MSGSRIRRCYISCRVESVYALRNLIVCDEFISESGTHFPVHSMTAAYNSQTKEARIYAEFVRVDEKIVEENMSKMGALSIMIDSFSKDDWAAESERVFRSVIECEGTAGFTLIRHGAEPRAANRTGASVEGEGSGGRASSGGEGGMGGSPADDNEDEDTKIKEPVPRHRKGDGDDRGPSKRQRTFSGDKSSGMDWASLISSAIASAGSAVTSAVRSEREDALSTIQQEKHRRERAEAEAQELRTAMEHVRAEETSKYEALLQAKDAEHASAIQALAALQTKDSEHAVNNEAGPRGREVAEKEVQMDAVRSAGEEELATLRAKIERMDAEHRAEKDGLMQQAEQERSRLILELIEEARSSEDALRRLMKADAAGEVVLLKVELGQARADAENAVGNAVKMRMDMEKAEHTARMAYEDRCIAERKYALIDAELMEEKTARKAAEEKLDRSEGYVFGEGTRLFAGDERDLRHGVELERMRARFEMELHSKDREIMILELDMDRMKKGMQTSQTLECYLMESANRVEQHRLHNGNRLLDMQSALGKERACFVTLIKSVHGLLDRCALVEQRLAGGREPNFEEWKQLIASVITARLDVEHAEQESTRVQAESDSLKYDIRFKMAMIGCTPTTPPTM